MRPPTPQETLRLGLLAIAVVVSALLTLESFQPGIWGVDMVVPLAAAGRWLGGGDPYPASAFAAGSGYDVPFLYPPLFLPFFGILTASPIAAIVGGNVVAALAGYAMARRLGVPPLAIPLLLLWPPFSGAIAGANLQLLLVAAFTWVYWDRAATGSLRPVARDWSRPGRPGIVDGVLAALIPTVKISQGHAWVGLLRLRPRPALVGLGVMAVTAAATMALTGTEPWFGWLAQTARAADPTWALRGAGLTRDLPGLVTGLFAAATMLAALVVPSRRAGAWIGIITVIGAPGLRMYGVLFLLPAMLELRREVALVAGILIATYTMQGLWAGIGLVAISHALAGRYPALREPIGR
jgi:hypothetical protein